MKLNKYSFLLSFFVCYIVMAQTEEKSYEIRYQSFVNGDIVAIGNNIVNRSKTFVSSNTPFNELGTRTKHNDEFYMKYIDIDDNPETFSSSSALLNLPEKTQKIAYAGLYWSGIYSYGEVVSKKNNEFEIKDVSRKNIDKILLKLPGKANYVSVKGEIIFDGKNEKEYENAGPYVVYSDVTEQVRDLESAKGEYTIANVRATQGTVLGGVSAGWILVVVYEQDNASSKKIITYDGFKDVYKGKVDIDFERFLTPNQGNIEVRLLGAALEGDNSMSGSSILVTSLLGEQFYLFNKLRPKKNFFNSTITSGDIFLNKRKPNSKNTLGFDIFNLKIPNENNSVIGNNATRMKISMRAKTDRYYSFFTALSISSEMISQDKPKKIEKNYKTEEKPEKEVIIKPKKLEETPVVKEMLSIEEKSPKSSAKTEKDNNPIVMISSEIPSGYYNIIGVFSKSSYRDRFLKLIEQKGYSPKFFYNSESGLNYIYIHYTNNLDQSRKNRNLLKDENIFKRIWILYVKK